MGYQPREMKKKIKWMGMKEVIKEILTWFRWFINKKGEKKK